MTKFWLALLLAIPLVPAFAEVGPNYDIIQVAENVHQYTTHYQRVQDIDGTWKNYIITEDATKINIKSATAFLEYSKTDCTYKIRDDSNTTLIPYVAWTAKRAQNGTDIWESMSVNSAQCSFEIDQQPEYVVITATKSLGDQKFEHELRISDRIKETVRVWQDTGSYKLGAVQTISGPEITINGQSINLAESAGLFLDRNWIIANEATIFEIANGLNYDFDIGFDHLWGIKVYSDKVALDYNNSGDDTEAFLEIDPTITIAAGSNPYASLTNTNSNIIMQKFEAGHPLIGGMPTEVSFWLDIYPGGAPTRKALAKIYDSSGHATLIAGGGIKETSSTGFQSVTNVWNGGASGAVQYTWAFSGTTVIAAGDRIGVVCDACTNDYQMDTYGSQSNPESNSVEQVVRSSDILDYSSVDMRMQVVYTSATAPGQVTGLSATGGNTQASLSWSAPSDGGSAITDYTIQYSTDNSSWSTFADGTSTSTSATVTGLTKNTVYYFRVAAVNAIGTGSYSTSASTTVLGVPDAPTSLSAASNANNQASLSWSAPANNGGSAITDYVIQYSTDGTTFSTFADGTSTSTSVTVTGLSSNTLYYFRVAAVNAIGTSSYSSSASTTVLPNPPGQVTNLATASPTTSQMTLSWTAPNNGGSAITDYTVQYSTDGNTFSTFADGTSTSTSVTVTGLSSNTLYYFRVAAVNAIGTGSYSSSATGITVPDPPTALTTASPTATSLGLSWTAPSGSQTTDYIIQYSTDGTNFSTFADGVSTSTSATVTGLSSNTLFYFRVATVSNPTSDYSSTATGTTLPGLISDLTVVSTNAVSASLSWTAPSGNVTITDYTIQYSTDDTTFTTFADGVSDSESATVTNLLSNVLYYFRVSATNSAGSGAYSGSVSDTTDNPEPVTTLIVPEKGYDYVEIEWDTPTLYGATVQGYQINFTTPYGQPLTKIVNSTNSTLTSYTIEELDTGTQYSFRVGLWTLSGGLRVSGANVANVTTFQSANFTLGGFDLESTNPNTIGIRLTQEASGSDKILAINYPTSYDLACDFDYRFAMQNQTYDNISGTQISGERSLATFTFEDPGTEVINAVCYDQDSDDSSAITITSSDFALLEQIQNFRSGEYGTMGQFGTLDLISVLIVIIAMIGFNRVNPAVGTIMATVVMFGLSYFGFINPITAGVSVIVSVIVLLAVITTRRKD